MGRYRIKDNVTGKTVIVSGDSPPTEADIPGIMQQAGLSQRTPADVTPEMARAKWGAANPNLADLQQIGGKIGQNAVDAAQDVYHNGYGPVANLINARTFNIAKNTVGLAGKGAQDAIFPQPTSIQGKILNFGGDVLGYGKTAANLAGLNALKNVGGVAKAVGINAAIGGLADANNAGERVAHAAGGAALAGGLGLAGGIAKNLHRATLGKVPFAEKVQTAVANKLTNLRDAFGENITSLMKKSPEKSVDMSDVVNQANAAAAFSPQMKYLVEKSPMLKRLLNNPELAKTVPLRESQDILNEYKANIPKGVLSGRNADINDAPALDVIHKIHDAQLAPFPEMAAARARYKAVLDNYDPVKSKFGEGRLLGAMENKFGDEQLNKRAKAFLDDPKLWKEINSYRRVRREIGAVKAAAGIGSVAGGVILAGKAAIEKAQGR